MSRSLGLEVLSGLSLVSLEREGILGKQILFVCPAKFPTMRGEIFLLQDNNELLEMNEQKYDSEDLLQSLLEDYPKLLAGSQINPSNPRRWLLIRREMGIPDKEQGAGRWSIDHLFLDQDGVPTLVEVKRSTDTRIRREVVAQMLDYAANSIQFWEINDIISSFQNTCEQRGDDPDEFFAEFIGDGFDQDDFWELVNANLRQGKIRMLFVADIIPPELQRIVEFLNEQMNPAEVMAVEVKQYTGQKLKTLVSRVVGQTMKAVDVKSVRSGKRQWDRESILEQIREERGEDTAKVVEKLIVWCEENGFAIKYGKGPKVGTVSLGWWLKSGSFCKLFEIYSGDLLVVLGCIKNYSPFDKDEMRLELITRLNEVQNISFKTDRIDTWSQSRAASLIDEKEFNKFCGVLSWISEKMSPNLRDEQ